MRDCLTRLKNKTRKKQYTPCSPRKRGMKSYDRTIWRTRGENKDTHGIYGRSLSRASPVRVRGDYCLLRYLALWLGASGKWQPQAHRGTNTDQMRGGGQEWWAYDKLFIWGPWSPPLIGFPANTSSFLCIVKMFSGFSVVSLVYVRVD